jgi:hypothetical protein
VIRVYDEAGNVIETHEHKGDFKSRKQFGRITSAHAIKQLLRLLLPAFAAGRSITPPRRWFDPAWWLT